MAALIRRAHEVRVSGAAEMMGWGTGTPRREFLHVDDLADASVVAVTRYAGEERLNVGTPPLPGGSPDLSYVEQVGSALGRGRDRRHRPVEESTVPANTGRRLEHVIAREQQRYGSTHRIGAAFKPGTDDLRESPAIRWPRSCSRAAPRCASTTPSQPTRWRRPSRRGPLRGPL